MTVINDTNGRDDEALGYDNSSDDIESTNKISVADLDEDGDIEDIDDYEMRSKAKQTQNSKHSLEVRRAIEDHLDKSKLRKELDYLFDDHFTDFDNLDEEK